MCFCKDVQNTRTVPRPLKYQTTAWTSTKTRAVTTSDPSIPTHPVPFFAVKSFAKFLCENNSQASVVTLFVNSQWSETWEKIWASCMFGPYPLWSSQTLSAQDCWQGGYWTLFRYLSIFCTGFSLKQPTNLSLADFPSRSLPKVRYPVQSWPSCKEYVATPKHWIGLCSRFRIRTTLS